MLKVNEIFNSIEGEGIRAGYPCVFIRFVGCNLRCSYCDTPYAYHEGKEMSVAQIMIEVLKYRPNRVTLTGGEPLLQPSEDLIELMWALDEHDIEINVETNGSINIKDFPAFAIYTVDYKSPSSGMCDKMQLDNFNYLRPKDVLKFVVGSEDDLKEALTIIRNYNIRSHIFFSPVFGAIEPAEIVEFMLSHNLVNCRVQLQLHKFIWDPDKRGV